MPGRAAGNFQIARIFGVRIGVSASWFFVLFIYIFILSGYFHNVLGGSRTTAYAVAVASALAFFASIVLHELGHALAARREGLQIDGIDLWFLGGMARMRSEPQTPGAEFRVAVAGPLVTLLVIGVCIGVGELADSGRFFDVATAREGFRVSPGLALIAWLASINVLVLLFNLVPAYPLDGSRMARAAVWKRTGDRNRGTLAMGRVGQAFALLWGAGGLALLVNGDSLGLWSLFLAFFIYQSANAAVLQSNVARRMEGVRVGDVMDRSPVVVPADTPLLDVQDDYLLRYQWPWFAVVDPTHHYLGIVSADRVQSEIAAGRPALTAAEVVTPDDMQARVDTNVTLDKLLRSDAMGRLGAMVAVDADGVLQGVVTLADVRKALTPLGNRAT